MLCIELKINAFNLPTNVGARRNDLCIALVEVIRDFHELLRDSRVQLGTAMHGPHWASTV